WLVSWLPGPFGPALPSSDSPTDPPPDRVSKLQAPRIARRASGTASRAYRFCRRWWRSVYALDACHVSAVRASSEVRQGADSRRLTAFWATSSPRAAAFLYHRSASAGFFPTSWPLSYSPASQFIAGMYPFAADWRTHLTTSARSLSTPCPS